MSDTDSEYGAPGVGPSAEGAARTSTITALFDNRSQAEATVERLREAELGAATVQLVSAAARALRPPHRTASGPRWRTSSFPARIARSTPKACAGVVISSRFPGSTMPAT